MKQFEAVWPPNVWSPARFVVMERKRGWLVEEGLYLQRYPITGPGINFPATFPCSDENLQSTLAAMRYFPFRDIASLASTLLPL